MAIFICILEDCALQKLFINIRLKLLRRNILKTAKKLVAVLLSALLIGAMFAGCSQKDSEATEITDKTMLIAYTEECAPFLYTDENGELAGFEVDLVKNTFDSFKGDFKNFAFIKVEPDYVLNEDTCYTDEDGNEYSAIIMCGGFHKNEGTANEDYHWSVNLIENNIITVVPSGSDITSYANISGKSVGVVSDTAMTALDKNTAVKNGLAAANTYVNSDEAFAALNNGEIDAVVIDSFEFYTYENNASFTVLNGVLDTIEYGFAFAPKNDYSVGFNEAVRELQSEDYGDGDGLTPLVTTYFGYEDACVFEYLTDGDNNA